MSNRRAFHAFYACCAALWAVFCAIGTAVGINYHSQWSVVPRVWQGVATALIPILALYASLFWLVPQLIELFKGKRGA